MDTSLQAAAPVSDASDIRERLRQRAGDLRSLGVERLGLFGSFTRGEEGPESDVDLLVDFESGEKTFDHFMELAFLLEELLGRRVELVTREALSPHLGPHILAEVEDVSLANGDSAPHWLSASL